MTPKAFIPYLTVGDPSLLMTEQLVVALDALGADVIEVGVPFSDPVADGVINQKSAERALKNHVTLEACCTLVKTVREKGVTASIVLFTYLNPILQMGEAAFAQRAAQCGITSVLVVDMPLEEGEGLSHHLRAHGLHLIRIVSPTTSPDRMKRICALSTHFVYYIARTGVTGLQDDVSPTLEQEIEALRSYASVPIYVGFGISTAEQARHVASLADGVIIGSALVKELEEPDPLRAKSNFLRKAEVFAQAIRLT
jgi:tryptophan synthase alpha chain